ncbi:tetratricopeptide repeat protein [Algiphilus sp. W345]|uniref:Tetratricopeptide repeat protein n=1 Tax=Banduia mediterranea TaxID=3075609 RepID=A0ABU2WK59_9GAMM|nr:tetratricopeptide repeat protein [Algiphilus sp. W345]MDT0498263.1 tetratricopeptide repeat protein [Algiphilus sp. W345]
MRCAEPKLLLVAALAALLAACGGTGTVRPTPSSQPAAEEPAPEEAEPEPEPEKEDPEGRSEAAVKLMRIGKTDEAIEAFRSLTQDFPGFSGPYTNLGILYAGREQREAAIGALSQAIQLNPENKVALNLLAIQYVESGNFERAEQSWLQALTVDPGYAAAHLNLGMLYERNLGRPQAAITQYRAYQSAMGGDALQVDVWVAEIEAATTTGGNAQAVPAMPSLETEQ